MPLSPPVTTAVLLANSVMCVLPFQRNSGRTAQPGRRGISTLSSGGFPGSRAFRYLPAGHGGLRWSRFLVVKVLLQLLYRLVDGERERSLARRKLPESLDELTERGGRYGEAILWYNLSLWWQEEQLRARGETGARNVDDAAVENDLAGAYMNRDPARKAKTAAYFEVGRRAYRQLDYSRLA
jgi:hypothetical protein